jgi:murein L,D-transpeptidase YcbB/YkuD
MKKFVLAIFAVLFFAFIWSSNDATETVQAASSAATRQNFDAAFYATENPDVVAAYGNSERRLLEHYIDYGRYEGRSASSEFNVLAYRDRYADLYQAFGDNLDAYARHYREYGIAEGRNAAASGTASNRQQSAAQPASQTASSSSRPLIYNMEGIAKGHREIGTTYVEVDIAAQHLYFFVDGVVVMDTDIVTGNPNRGWSTPTGIFQIYSREHDRYLRGPGYKVWVKYWMPFHGGYGLHDAGYRSEFGGDIYQSDGSHGCVNIPRDKARILYDQAYVGMYVICH